MSKANLIILLAFAISLLTYKLSNRFLFNIACLISLLGIFNIH